MSRRMEDLADSFRPLASELLRRSAEAGVPLRVIDTLRTAEEHAANLRNGVSWTKVSKHLTGLAIDVCPEQYLAIKGWCPGGQHWLTIGAIGESLGLRWGGRWKQRDLGHFEYVERAAWPG